MLNAKESSFKKVCTHAMIEKTPKVKKDTGKKKKFVVVSEKSIGKKKENPKRKYVFVIEDVVEDVENNIYDLMVPPFKKNKKIFDAKKIPGNVHTSPLENVSFHFEECVLK